MVGEAQIPHRHFIAEKIARLIVTNARPRRFLTGLQSIDRIRRRFGLEEPILLCCHAITAISRIRERLHSRPRVYRFAEKESALHQ